MLIISTRSRSGNGFSSTVCTQMYAEELEVEYVPTGLV